MRVGEGRWSAPITRACSKTSDPATVDQDRLACDPLAGSGAEQEESPDEILGWSGRLPWDSGGDRVAEGRVLW